MKIQRRKKRHNEAKGNEVPVQKQFQSRPFQDANFAPPDQELTRPEMQFQQESSGFDLANIPVFANRKRSPEPIQRTEDDDIQMKGEPNAPMQRVFQTLAQRDNPTNGTPQQPIQAKLTVGAVGDKYEQEADRVADVVVGQIQSPPRTTEIQKREEEGGQEQLQLATQPTISKLQKKPLSGRVQREPEDLEEAIAPPETRARSNAVMPLSKERFESYKNIVGELFKETSWEKHGKTKKGKEYQRRDKFAYELLKDHEIEALERLSQTPEGRKYLLSLESSSVKGRKRQEFSQGAGENTYDIAEYYKKQAEQLDQNQNSPLTKDWLATGSNVSSMEFWSKRKLTSMERLLIATYQAKLGQANDDYKNTPGYLRYEALQAKGGSEEHKEAIYKKDTDAWEKLLNINEGNKKTIQKQLAEKLKKDGQQITEDEAKGYVEKSLAIANIMRRVFTVLQYNLEYSDDKNAQGEGQKEKPMYARDWNKWTKQVAVSLSHGGRVNIVLPPIGEEQHGKKHNRLMNWLSSSNEKETKEYYDKRDDFVNWLFGVQKGHHAHKRSQEDLAGTDYQKAEVGTRFVSTHDVEIKEDSFKELKGNNISTGQSEVHYGINPALGGLGETDLSGNVILPDGSHGHIYIFYKPPTSKLKGAVLIGGETSEMGKRDVFGKLHNASGTSAEFSPTGTGKAARIGSEIGGMRVDLSGFKSQADIVSMFEDAMIRGVEPGQLVGESKPEVREALFELGLNKRRLAISEKENIPENP
ncbi:hypothetical protein ACOKW7_11235 [Limnospira platensis CENA597]|uniref:hypothetical protein n=2 Tax=Limnospira platensis TaxID=118562 RepID=UPI003D6FF8A3